MSEKNAVVMADAVDMTSASCDGADGRWTGLSLPMALEIKPDILEKRLIMTSLSAQRRYAQTQTLTYSDRVEEDSQRSW